MLHLDTLGDEGVHLVELEFLPKLSWSFTGRVDGGSNVIGVGWKPECAGEVNLLSAVDILIAEELLTEPQFSTLSPMADHGFGPGNLNLLKLYVQFNSRPFSEYIHLNRPPQGSRGRSWSLRRFQVIEVDLPDEFLRRPEQQLVLLVVGVVIVGVVGGVLPVAWHGHELREG